MKPTSSRTFSKKVELELFLEKIPRFTKPNKILEQYVTPSKLASKMLWDAMLRGDIRGRIVADLGCGTGRLLIGAAVLGAKLAVGVDVDRSALETLRRHVKRLELDNVELVQAYIPYNPLRRVDTTVQNPPFGVWNRGVDLEFLRSALEISSKVYTIHKQNIRGRKLIVEEAEKKGYKLESTYQEYMEIPAMLPEHKRRIYRFKVEVYSFSRGVRDGDQV